MGTRSLALMVLVALTACASGSPEATRRESDGGAATPAPVASVPLPSGSSPPAPGMPVGTVVMVVADGVRVRTSAGTSGETIGSLRYGAIADITSGPIDADGFRWYEVDAEATNGWIAEGDGAMPWIVEVPREEPADLVFRFRAGCDVTGPIVEPAMTVLADGRVIVGPQASAGRGWMVRRLTEAGLAVFADMIASQPELQQSAEYLPERRPGTPEPPGHGGCGYWFTRGVGQGAVVVTSTSWFGDEEESQYWMPAPERKALDGLARQLMEGFEVFPRDEWVDEPQPYEAATYLVTVTPQPAPPPPGPSTVDATLLPMADWREFGEAVETATAPLLRCGYLLREQAAEIVTAANEAGWGPIALDAVSYLMVREDETVYGVALGQRAPDGYPSCDDNFPKLPELVR